jgi:cell division protein FtsB
MKLGNCIFTALVIILGCISLYLLLPSFTRLKESKQSLASLEKNLAQQEEQIQSLRAEIHALRTDYRAIERVAREKFGLCREGEKIYHFDPPAPSTTK